MPMLNGRRLESHGYAPVNGLKMYYEIEGQGDPLVYLPPAFGFAGMKSLPGLASNRALITVDFQGHGRTVDLPERPLSLEQHAEDVATLMRFLGIPKADFFGESYGGAVATLLAVHQPELVGAVATYGATFGAPQLALNFEMLRMEGLPTADSQSFRFQREAYERVAPDPAYWPRFWSKLNALQWQGFSNEQLAGIRAPVLIALGDHDFVRLDHALDTFRRIPNAELAVIPDAGHFALFSEPVRVIPVIENFLNQAAKKVPIATAGSGYVPGETR